MSFKSWSAEQKAAKEEKNQDGAKVSTVIGPVIDQPTVSSEETPGVSKPAPKP
jgi:hypothetical protein